MKSLKAALPLMSLCLLISCGSDSSGGGGSDSVSGGGSVVNQNEEIMADGSNVDGIYATELWPINYNLHFKEVGAAAVQREGDNFTATVKLKYGPRDMVHKQAIYTGRRCPNLNDDLNKDAYIDMMEAKYALGYITIPLDGNLDSQDAGAGQYPAGDATGQYLYQKSASFDRMFADLKAPDTNLNDNIVKVDVDSGITFPGRVILIQGIGQNALLPTTIATENGEDPHRSLPVACGVLWKVNEMPELLRQ